MTKHTLWLLLLAGLTGCYSYAPVEVHVINAQTKRPLSGVRVKAEYTRFMEFFPPKLDRAVTDADGVAMLSVCTNYTKLDRLIEIEVDSDTANYFLDKPMPGAFVEVPVADVLKANGSPYRVDIAVLTAEEYRRRYPYP